MGRAPCCDKANVKKGPWSPEEDAKLKDYIDKHGTGGNWIALPQKVGLKRCGKSCRLRWLNYLRPNIKHGEFSEAEDRVICSLYATIGSRWSIIASQLPGRTDNDIKNYWNTKLKKKMMSFNHPLSSPQTQRKQHPHQAVTLLSMFQNSTSSSSSSSSSLSPPLSFSSSNNSSFYHPHQGYSSNFNASASSYSSSILSGNSNNFDETQENFLCHPHPQNCQFKDSSNNNSIFVFGGEATSCSSSDGSCNNNNNQMNSHVMEAEFGDGGFVDQINVANYLYSSGVEDAQKLIHSSSNGSVISEWTEKQSGLLWGGENPMDYGLEEIKELISSTSTCNNFLFDQKKQTEESVIMYY